MNTDSLQIDSLIIIMKDIQETVHDNNGDALIIFLGTAFLIIILGFLILNKK